MSFAKSLKNPQSMVIAVVLIVVGLQILVQLLPDLITAITNISTVENLAFASFFASGGVVLLVLSVGIILALLGFFMPKGGKGR